MDHGVNLCEFMAFILVDHEDISGLNGIKFLVDQELFPAGNRIVNFIAVVDMHIHGLFFFIQMGYGKGTCYGTGVNCLFTRKKFFHAWTPFYAQGRVRKFAAKAARAPRGEQGENLLYSISIKE